MLYWFGPAVLKKILCIYGQLQAVPYSTFNRLCMTRHVALYFAGSLVYSTDASGCHKKWMTKYRTVLGTWYYNATVWIGPQWVVNKMIANKQWWLVLNFLGAENKPPSVPHSAPHGPLTCTQPLHDFLDYSSWQALSAFCPDMPGGEVGRQYRILIR